MLRPTNRPVLMKRQGLTRNVRTALNRIEFGQSPASRRPSPRTVPVSPHQTEQGDFALLAAVSRACHFESAEDFVASVQSAYANGPRTVSQTPTEADLVLSTATSTIITSLQIVSAAPVILQAHVGSQSPWTPFLDVGIDGMGANDTTNVKFRVIGLDDTTYPGVIQGAVGARIPILGAMGSTFQLEVTAPSATAGNPVVLVWAGLQGRPESFPIFGQKSLLEAFIHGMN